MLSTTAGGPQPPRRWSTAAQGWGAGEADRRGREPGGREGPERGVPVTPDSHQEAASRVSPGTCEHTHNPGPTWGPGGDPLNCHGPSLGRRPFQAEGRPRVPPAGEVEAAAACPGLHWPRPHSCAGPGGRRAGRACQVSPQPARPARPPTALQPHPTEAVGRRGTRPPTWVPRRAHADGTARARLSVPSLTSALEHRGQGSGLWSQAARLHRSATT